MNWNEHILYEKRGGNYLDFVSLSATLGYLAANEFPMSWEKDSDVKCFAQLVRLTLKVSRKARIDDFLAKKNSLFERDELSCCEYWSLEGGRQVFVKKLNDRVENFEVIACNKDVIVNASVKISHKLQVTRDNMDWMLKMINKMSIKRPKLNAERVVTRGPVTCSCTISLDL